MELLGRVWMLISAPRLCMASMADPLRSQAVHGPARPRTSRLLAMTLHPTLTAVPAPPQPMTALERADTAFAPRTPAESRAGNPRALLAGLPQQHDVPDPAVLRRAFIGPRGEAAIGDGQLRSQSLSASGRRTSTRLRCRYARRTMAPPMRPCGLRGLHHVSCAAARPVRSHCFSHRRALLASPSTNNCAFGQDSREAACPNTGCPRPNSHRKVTEPAFSF